MKDDLGKRMKEKFEIRSQTYLPRRCPAIIRVDGKAFHTLVKAWKCVKPFDSNLMQIMDETAAYMCQNIMGAVMAYVQSDEISILLSDYTKITTDAWFDYNVQKMTSVSASLATLAFNTYGQKFGYEKALFDSRVFSIPDKVEVENYFIWRQKDAERNSIQAVAQSLYSHKELLGKKTPDLNEMIWKKGQNWNNFTAGEKRGRVIIKKQYVSEDGKTIRGWEVLKDTPMFSKDKSFLRQVIPELGY